MKRKLLALSLAILMLVFAFIGCQEPKDDNPEQTTPSPEQSTTPEETTTSKPEPTFVDKKFNTTFTVFTRPANAESYPGTYIDTDDQITDVMSSAVYTRNITVEEKYGITIETIRKDTPYRELPKHLEAGEVPYDIILDKRQYMPSLIRAGQLYDFNDLDHVDFSQSYWDANCIEGYEIDGKLFLMANDVSVSNISGVRFFYYNKKLITDYNLEDPYDLVKSNQWTLDKLLTMITAVSTDNGDGIWDGQDTYGLLLETPTLFQHMLVGCGQTYVEKQNDGVLTTNIYNDKTETIMTKIYDAVEETNYAITYSDAAGSMDREGMNVYNFVRRRLFTTDHFLFVHSSLSTAQQYAEMKSDYGVAPNPKYNSSQEKYYHKFDKNTLIWAIPNSDQMDYDKIGAIMEYWSYVSSDTVMPAYYEITIKTKRVRDEKDSEMIDLIKSSMCYDIDDVFNPGITKVLNEGYGKGTLASSWAASKESLDAKLAEIYQDIVAIK